MSEPAPIQSLDLPHLALARIGTVDRDIIVTSSADLEVPQLQVNNVGDFSYKYENGQLEVVVNEPKPETGGPTTLGSVTMSGAVRIGRATEGDMHLGSNGSASDNSRSVNVPSVNSSISLVVPKGYKTSYGVFTTSGEVSLSGLEVGALKVIASGMGKVALRDIRLRRDADIRSNGGDIKMMNLRAQEAVVARSAKAGVVGVRDSEAPGWTLDTEAGDVIVKNTGRTVNASSARGRVRFSQ